MMCFRNQKLILLRDRSQFLVLLPDDLDITKQNNSKNKNGGRPQQNKIFYKILPFDFYLFQFKKFFIFINGLLFFCSFKFFLIFQNLVIIKLVIIIFGQLQTYA